MADSVPFPANAVTFFKAPISTLLESLDSTSAARISGHDKLEAYSTLSNRLGAIVKAADDEKGPIPALLWISEHAAAFARCLRRDMQRSIVSDTTLDNMSSGYEIQITAPAHCEEDLAKRTRDEAVVQHHALKIVACVFRFRSLSSMFAEDELCSLIDGVLQVLSTRDDAEYNMTKTRVIATWVLSDLRLPDHCLQHKQGQLVAALEVSLQASHTQECTIDSLGTIHHFLAVYPLLFFKPLAQLFPLVLDLLTSTSPAVGKQAAHALSGYALAYLNCEMQLSKQAKETVRESIRVRILADRSAARYATPDTSLVRLFSIAFGFVSPTHSDRTAVWTTIVLASLVILCDTDIFTQPDTLKLVARSLIPALSKKQPVMHVLHGCVWKCFIWAFMRLERPDEHTLLTAARATEVARPTLRHRAFQFVKQEHRRGLGVTIAACLVQHYCLPGSPDIQSEVSKALELVKEMVSDRHLDAELEGISILAKLISSIGASIGDLASHEEQVERKLVARELFDGTLLRAQWKDIPRTLSTTSIECEDLRLLTETEVLDHWEDILEIWTICVHKSLTRALQLTRELTHIWQALLLVQAQLTQEHGNFTTSPDFCRRAVEIMESLLLWKLEEPSQPSALSLQKSQLSVAGQLWRVMKNVFGPTWLQSAASSFLVCVLRQDCDIENSDVKALKSALCQDLIHASSLYHVGRVLVENELPQAAEMKRHLWNSAASQWISFDPPASWQDSVSFLLVPLTVWAMSEHELATWKDILDHAVLQSALIAVSSLTLIETLFKKAKEQSKSLPTCPEVLPWILHHLHPEAAESGFHTFTELSEILCALYSRRSEHLRVALLSVRAVAAIIKRTPPQHAVHMVAVLSEGLMKWIRDDDGKLLQGEYNDSVMLLYADALDILGGLPLTMEDLETLSQFLAAGFTHIVPPARGPLSFKKFWENVYPDLRGQMSSLPPAVEECVRACHAAFGLALPLEMDAKAASHSQFSRTQEVFDSHRGQSAQYSPAVPVSPRLLRSVYTPSASVMPSVRHSNDVPLSRNHVNSRTPTRRGEPNTYTMPPEVHFTSDLDIHSSTTPSCPRRQPISPTVPSPSIPSPIPAKRSIAVLMPEPHDVDARHAKRVRMMDDESVRENQTSTTSSAMPSTGQTSSLRYEHVIQGPGISGTSFQQGSGPQDSAEAAAVDETADAVPATPLSHGQFHQTCESNARDNADDTVDSLPTPPDGEEPLRPAHEPSTPEADDYASWERVVITAEGRRIQQVSAESGDLSGIKEEPPSPTPGPTRNVTPAYERDNTALASSPPVRSRQPSFNFARAGPSHLLPLRSQTVPSIPTSGLPPTQPTGMTHAPLTTLSQLRDHLARGRSQMPMEELLAGLRMLHEMNGMLNEELSQRLGGGSKGG